ncbi:glutamate--tRNA ligase [Chitinophaga sp. Hz27]|uniref:glutamate--tRNA ligase n=1 Tax=Chitinophaga sp. Hz27 TaxID=3347169 RepID=UPI0035D84103
MNHRKVRVRFAPSPTGGLHLGGVRTVLFNYLFAKHHNGDFVLRIEDTDQTRFVPGAEDYINECLRWCGLQPDESPGVGGPYEPYRQSERKPLYREYAEKLVASGHAYYAFDTVEELESMRERLKTPENPAPQYNHIVRAQMRNSLNMLDREVEELLARNTPHVIRIKMPENDTLTFTDMIRGDVTFNTGLVDDKVLLKADGMPTYHLAVVVDDYLMKISHAFRGEEWLPSAPVHILLWKYLGWEADMPQWAHLPLILKPDGNGKLSKRDGDRLGFPVYAMNWTDPRTNEFTKGFRELGFLPEAFVNMLAMLGWNDGTEQEIFSLEELVQKFSMDRVHKAGAKFDFEKAKWYNHQHILVADNDRLATLLQPILAEKDIHSDIRYISDVAALVKDRLHVLSDFYEHSYFFFERPKTLDSAPVVPKWTIYKEKFFNTWLKNIDKLPKFPAPMAAELEDSFKKLAAEMELKMGDVQLPFRIMLTGGKFGPPVFDIAATLGITETQKRIAIGIDTYRKAWDEAQGAS